jgi:hypothetical protein
MPSVRQGPVYGGVTVSQEGYFQSFLVGVEAYHAGELNGYDQTKVFLIENYWYAPLVAMLLAFMIAAWLRYKTEQVAARRLAAGKIY